jgi:hypothetical protein
MLLNGSDFYTDIFKKSVTFGKFSSLTHQLLLNDGLLLFTINDARTGHPFLRREA